MGGGGSEISNSDLSVLERKFFNSSSEVEIILATVIAPSRLWSPKILGILCILMVFFFESLRCLLTILTILIFCVADS